MPADDDTVDHTPIGKGRRKPPVHEEEDPRAGRLPGWECGLLLVAAVFLLGGLGGLVYFAAATGGRPTRPDTGTKQSTERPPSPVPSTAAPTPAATTALSRPPTPASSSPVDRPAGKGTVAVRASPESPVLLAATREALTAAAKGEAARSKGVVDGSVVVLTAPADVELVNRGLSIAVVRHAGKQWVVDVTALGGR